MSNVGALSGSSTRSEFKRVATIRIFASKESNQRSQQIHEYEKRSQYHVLMNVLFFVRKNDIVDRICKDDNVANRVSLPHAPVVFDAFGQFFVPTRSPHESIA